MAHPETTIEMPAHIKDFLMICDDGSFLIPSTPTSFLPDILKMEMRSSDVIVVTWPKSGTTWMQYIVTQLIYGKEIADEKNLFETNIFLEIVQNPFQPDDSEGFYKLAEGRPSPRLLKSHLKLHMLPKCLFDSKAKVIYVVRNPKDAAVSYFNFCRMNPFLPPYKDWSEFFEYFRRGLLPWGDWFEHVLPWWEKRNEPNVLFIKYEDMKKDLVNAVTSVSEFLGKSLSDDEIEDICARSSFEAMKKNPAASPDLAHPILSKRDPTIQFMRKGEIGNWKNYFTVAQNERFDEMYKHKMEGTGLQLEFE